MVDAAASVFAKLPSKLSSQRIVETLIEQCSRSCEHIMSPEDYQKWTSPPLNLLTAKEEVPLGTR